MVSIIVRRDQWVQDESGHRGEATEAYGLSTDVVGGTIPKVKNPYNAMPFMAMDTGDLYLYDEENGTWILQEV